MFKQQYRKQCREALITSGYHDPQLFFDRVLARGGKYTSYWGDGMSRMEVICFKKSGAVHIFKLKFC